MRAMSNADSTRFDPRSLDASTGRPPRRRVRGIRRREAARRTVLALAVLFLVLLSGSGPAPAPARAAAPAADASTETPDDQAPPPTATPAPDIQELKTRLDLKEPFNLAQGKVRIIVFFSPTCMHCITNANGLQQLVLDKLDTPDIEVFAVWLKMLDTDDRAAVDRATTVLHDPRVHHYWDTKLVLNAQLLDAIQFDIQLRLYNIELLYDRAATWDKRLPRPPYWMQEYRGAPGPTWNAATFADEVLKALENKPIDTPIPR